MTKGEIIKWKESKRVRFCIENIDTAIPYTHKITLIPIYKPAPKSTWNNKSVFSKFKILND